MCSERSEKLRSQKLLGNGNNLDYYWGYSELSDDWLVSRVRRNLPTIAIVLISLSTFRAKFPQLLTIYKQKSAKGVSLKSLTIEVISYSVSTLYNFTNEYRWINYFEYVILIVQDYFLIAIVLFYRLEINKKTVAVFVAYSCVVSLFASGIAPKNLLTFLIVSFIPAVFDRAKEFLIFSPLPCQCPLCRRFCSWLKF